MYESCTELLNYRAIPTQATKTTTVTRRYARRGIPLVQSATPVNHDHDHDHRREYDQSSI